MPEQPHPKIRSPAARLTTAAVGRTQSALIQGGANQYAELHCLTNYSFLQAASHPDELVLRAAELGYAALAITDRHSLAGVVRAHAAAKPLGLKLLIGTEITPSDGPTAILLAMNRTGYGRLARLLTLGKRRATKGECHLTFSDLAEHSTDLLACVLLDSKAPEAQISELERWRDLFGDRCYLTGQLHRGPADDWMLQRFQCVSQQTGLKLVASNGVLYHDSSRRYLHDVLTAVRLGCTVADLGKHRKTNGECHLKSADEMRSLFGGPELIECSLEVANRCTFSLDELRYEYPEELCPHGHTPLSWLTRLTWKGARYRYPEKIPDHVDQLIRRELALIEELQYEAYFLTVHDLVHFARQRHILCQGRGSAANSAVCYCLGVTSVDPALIDVLFERFISKERGEAPDIDVDFEHERREEVLQYLYDKYGRERAGMTAEVITYRLKSAVRDIGKALGLSADCVDSLARTAEHSSDEPEVLASRFREVGFDPGSRLGRQLTVLIRQLLGFPRHLSQHVGGMVITRDPLCEVVPIENAAMADRTVIEWDKEDLDVLGILKVDCLALGMLTAIRKAFDLVRLHIGRELTLANIPPNDANVYAMLQRAESIGVFQVESRAQMSTLPRLKPKEFYDLVVQVAIIRPGPIQGGMVHPYLRRRADEEKVTYPSDEVRKVLEKTFGVPIFQEQAMKLAIVAAGFTPGEADQLRRAMGAWRKTGVMEVFRQKLIGGMLSNGYEEDFANRLFEQIRGFGEYGFPESHAASFALLVYVSAWLKHHYPAAFTAALLNSQPMGFYAPAQLVSEARRQKVHVCPVDVNASEWDCTLERQPDSSLALRLGLRQLRGMSQAAAELITVARRSRSFDSQADFAARTQLGRRELSLLAKADAFHSLTVPRRTALWNAMVPREAAPLFAAVDDTEAHVALPQMTRSQEVTADYQTVGLSLRAHPMSFLRTELDELRVTRNADLLRVEADRRYRIAGLVLMRQRPSTAKGITFFTIEDETGTANLIVHVKIWERFRRVARSATAIIAHGILQRQYDVSHLVVDRMDDLTDKIGPAANRSRDFH